MCLRDYDDRLSFSTLVIGASMCMTGPIETVSAEARAAVACAASFCPIAWEPTAGAGLDELRYRFTEPVAAHLTRALAHPLFMYALSVAVDLVVESGRLEKECAAVDPVGFDVIVGRCSRPGLVKEAIARRTREAPGYTMGLAAYVFEYSDSEHLLDTSVVAASRSSAPDLSSLYRDLCALPGATSEGALVVSMARAFDRECLEHVRRDRDSLPLVPLGTHGLVFERLRTADWASAALGAYTKHKAADYYETVLPAQCCREASVRVLSATPVDDDRKRSSAVHARAIAAITRRLAAIVVYEQRSRAASAKGVPPERK